MFVASTDDVSVDYRRRSSESVDVEGAAVGKFARVSVSTEVRESRQSSGAPLAT
jgi:hypothetical protein